MTNLNSSSYLGGGSEKLTEVVYKPTTIQKLLGRNYKWWYTSTQGFKSNTTYRYNSVSWLLSSFVSIAGTLVVWYISFFQNGSLNVIGFKEIFTYLIIGEACIFSSAIQYDIGEDILKGDLTTKILLPTDYLLRYFFYQFGYQLFENLSKAFLYLIIGLVFNKYLISTSISNIMFFAFICIIAYFINVLIGIIIGATAFWLTAFFGSAALFDNLKMVLGGRLFPLNKLQILLPLVYTPFAFTFYHPMQIYLGKYSPLETFCVFLGGIAWCIVLYFLAKWVFKMGLKRNEAIGL